MIFINKLFIKGILIGIAGIVPGISGGALAISLGLYEKLICIAANIFHNFKENIKFLFPIILGATLAVVGLSKGIKYMLDFYYVPTILMFCGFIMGGFKDLFNNVDKGSMKFKNIIISVISFIIVITLVLINPNNDRVVDYVGFNEIVTLIGVGFIYSFTMVIPGVSGTFFLMILGYYDLLLEALSLSNFAFSIKIMIPFIFGLILGIIILSKIIERLLVKHSNIVYYAIFGFVISSVVAIVFTIKDINLLNMGIGLVLWILGFCISLRLNKV